jgi:hypothetical protein
VVLWISGTSVAPHLVELVMSEKTMQYLVSVALVVLALIPEVILANAIVNALGHVYTAAQKKTVVSWIWAALFTLPTILFLFLTAYTLNRLSANDGNFVQAGTGMIGLRCFAGWSYGPLEMVYTGIGRRMVSQAQPVITPAQPAPAQIDYQESARQLLPLVDRVVRQSVPDTTHMGEQLQQLRATVEELTVKNAPENTQKCEERNDTDAPESDTEPRTEERNTITLMSAARRTTTRTKSEDLNQLCAQIVSQSVIQSRHLRIAA